MFAEICRKKRELERGDIPAERNHPWRELDHETCSAHPVDLGSIDRPEIVAAVGGERVFRAAQAWLDGRRGLDGELAIDFEVFTGVDLPGPLIATSLKVSLLTRTKQMAKMLATLSSALVAARGGSLMPAEKKVRVDTLRTVGGSPYITGYTRRPIFRGGKKREKYWKRSCCVRALALTASRGARMCPRSAVDKGVIVLPSGVPRMCRRLPGGGRGWRFREATRSGFRTVSPFNGERAKGTDGACSQQKRGRDEEQAGGSARKKPKPQQPPLNEKRTPKEDSPQAQPKRSREDEQAQELRSRPRKQSTYAGQEATEA
ncbi:hypothetical protein DIPPA_16413 [Diplonema papillatum]|nr:hypothetical protein DIPPA_16413 [Diplonema papillatum]